MIARLAIALLLGGSSLLHAQAVPTASRAGGLQGRAGFTIANPGYGQQSFQGFTAFADFDLRSHLGIEAEFHRALHSTGDQSYQRTYLLGGRYFRPCGPLVPYVKVMFGRGDFNYPFGATDLAYNLFAAGVGADYRLRPLPQPARRIRTAALVRLLQPWPQPPARHPRPCLPLRHQTPLQVE